MHIHLQSFWKLNINLRFNILRKLKENNVLNQQAGLFGLEETAVTLVNY